MATAQGLTDAIDRVIALFNAKAMDLPDGFFDRRTQFVLNGAPFETLLGQPPTDALVLMLTRGPAGYRFMAKALQHALIEARVIRGEIDSSGNPFEATVPLHLSGTLRGTGEKLTTVVAVTLKLGAPDRVDVAHAVVDAADLNKIRAARVQP
jgi:hypothetical protein